MSEIDKLGLEVEYVPHRVELFNPETGEPLLDEKGDPAWIEIDGFNSAAGEKITRQNRMKLEAQARAGRKAPSEIDLDKARQENANVLAQLTRAWYLVNTAGQAVQDFPCNYENARSLYAAKSRAWIGTQLLAALNESANFIKT